MEHASLSHVASPSEGALRNGYALHMNDDERLRMIWASASDAMVVSDADGIVLDANPAYFALYGYSPTDIINHPYAIIFPLEERAIATERYRAIFRAPRSAGTVESKIQRADGTTRVVEVSYDFLTRDGQRTALLSMIRDITERKNAEMERDDLLKREKAAREAAQAAEQQMRFLAEATTILNASLDYETTLHSLSRLIVPRLADWCSIDVREADGRMHCLGATHNDPAREAAIKEITARYWTEFCTPQHVLPRVLASGVTEVFYSFDPVSLESIYKAEHRRLLRILGVNSLMVVPLIARHEVLGTMMLVSSQPDRHYEPADKEIAEALAERAALAIDNARLYQQTQVALAAQKESDALKDRFISIASHELRTPLTTIKGYTQMLQRNTAKEQDNDPSPLHARNVQMLESLHSQIDRMNRMIGEMLDVSRIQAGQLPLSYSPEVDVVERVRQVVEQHENEEKDHQIRVLAPQIAIPVRLDLDRIEQVLNNLISNACKYSPAGTEVVITVEQATTPDAVVVSVRDQGIGIAPEVQAHIFQPFYRVQRGDSAKIEGLGLGLYISADIIERHGGRLWLDSTPGMGSTFSFSLPATPDDTEQM